MPASAHVSSFPDLLELRMLINFTSSDAPDDRLSPWRWKLDDARCKWNRRQTVPDLLAKDEPTRSLGLGIGQ